MAFKKPVVNKITADIANISIYLRSTKKFGKTTLFRDVIMAKYGDPERGLLIACGNEQGYAMLDNLNVVNIDNYKDLVDLCNWLIKEKGKEHNIEIVAFDTGDELALIADKETIARSKEETGKPCKSIKAAFGGFQAGPEYSANNVVKPIISGLKKAGFGIWVIAHTKFKTIKEKGGLDEDGYMQLTSNLTPNMESAFGDCLDVVITGVIDRDTEKKTKKVGQSTKTENYVTDTVRKLYFRGTTLIDAGGRFSDGAVPEYMIFDKKDMGAEFIKVIEEGIEKSKTSSYESKEPIFKPEKVNIPYDEDEKSVVSAQAQAADDLKSVIDQIIAIAKSAGGSTNEELMTIVREYAPKGNPHVIKDIEKAKELLTKLQVFSK